MAARDLDAVTGRFPTVDVSEWLETVFEGAGAPIELQIQPQYERPDGVVATVRLYVARMKKGGYGSYDIGSKLLHEKDGRWVVDLIPPLDARVVAVDAQVRITPASEWLEVDVSVTVQGDTAVLPLRLSARRPGEGGWLRVLEVSQDAVPVPFKVTEGRLVVAPANPAAEVTLRIRYAGESPQNDGTYIRPDDVLLRGSDSRWLPLLPDTRASFKVTVYTPEGFVVHGQGDEEPQGTAEGWTSRTFRYSGKAFSLYGAPAYVEQIVPWGDTELRLALWPQHEDWLGALAEVTGRAAKALDPLGPYPFATARLVESGYTDGQSGYGSLSNLALGWRTLERPKPTFIAHELSHGWFGGRVPLAPSALSRGQWAESMASYVGTWTVSQEQASSLRSSYLQKWQSLKRDRPIMAVGTASASWSTHDAISYSKGALLLTALEDRLGGRTALVKVLRRFLDQREGQASTWEDFVVLLDADTATWFRTRLERAGAPTPVLAELQRKGRRLKGEVRFEDGVQGDSVMLGFLDKEGVVLDLRRVSGPFTLRIPRGAVAVQLDPTFRMPRRGSTEAVAIP
jgi:hypothetical protein